MADTFDHGRKLTEDEYQRAIIALYTDTQNQKSPDQKLHIQRKELDLTIDYRLGVNFPQERRDALWLVQQSIERRRIGLMVAWLLNQFFSNMLNRQTQRLANYVIDEYAKVLTSDEILAFFGDDLKDS